MCCSIATCNICLRKKCFEACYQTIFNLISIANENKNSKENSDDSDDLQKTHDSDDDVTVDGDYFSKNNQNNNVFRNDSDYFLGMCDPPDVEYDDISEANSHNYFAIGVVED